MIFGTTGVLTPSSRRLSKAFLRLFGLHAQRQVGATGAAGHEVHEFTSKHSTRNTSDTHAHKSRGRSAHASREALHEEDGVEAIRPAEERFPGAPVREALHWQFVAKRCRRQRGLQLLEGDARQLHIISLHWLMSSKQWQHITAARGLASPSVMPQHDAHDLSGEIAKE